MTESARGQTPPTVDASATVSEQEDMVRLLVCPADHGELRLEGQILTCTVCGRRYPIEDGVPNMLLGDDQT